MFAPFMFVGGVLSFLVGESGQVVKRNNYWRQYYEDKSAGYDQYTQTHYSSDRIELWQRCDIIAMRKLIEEDLKCGEYKAYMIAEAAACKYLMELQTPYKYKQSGITEGLDLKKYLVIKKSRL